MALSYCQNLFFFHLIWLILSDTLFTLTCFWLNSSCLWCARSVASSLSLHVFQQDNNWFNLSVITYNRQIESIIVLLKDKDKELATDLAHYTQSSILPPAAVHGYMQHAVHYMSGMYEFGHVGPIAHAIHFMIIQNWRTLFGGLTFSLGRLKPQAHAWLVPAKGNCEFARPPTRSADAYVTSGCVLRLTEKYSGRVPLTFTAHHSKHNRHYSLYND